MQTKSTIAFLNSQYKNILKKCLVASLLAVAPVCAMAATNPTGSTVPVMIAAEGDPELINNGTVTGESLGFASLGMYGFNRAGSIDYNFVNNASGVIKIEADIENVYAMSAISFGKSNIMLNNYGEISVRSDTNYAVGMSANTDTGNNMVVNYGNVFTFSGIGASIGMLTENSSGTNALVNYGTITAISSIGVSIGMEAEGGGTLTNYNTITVMSGGRVAIGMQIYDDGVSSVVNNYGVITVASVMGSAAEVSFSNITAGSGYTVGTWATNLRTWAPNDVVFEAGLFNTINFNQDTTLILRPDTADRGFVLGQEYNVADMISGTAVGMVGSVTSDAPLMFATLTGDTVANQTVSLNIDKMGNAGHRIAHQTISRFRDSGTRLNNVLQGFEFSGKTLGNTPSGDVNPLANWDVAFSPYASRTDNDEFNYDGLNIGVVGAANYKMENASLGFHTDLNYSDYDTNAGNIHTNTNGYGISLGLHGSYDLSKDWYLSSRVTGSYTHNDGEFTSGFFTADDGFASYAGDVNIGTGYRFAIDEKQTVIPEINVSYLYIKNNGYNMNFSDMMNIHVADETFNNFYATASVRYQGDFNIAETDVRLHGRLGVRQNIGDNDINSDFTAYGNAYTSQASEDRTTMLLGLGAELRQDENTTITMFYEGDYGSNQMSHTGGFRVNYEF